MNKEEILNDEFIENEITQQKTHKKLKIAVAIVGSLALIAIATLLVGHFKFNWFKSEVYNIDAKITRNLYQANYFSETKTVKTKNGFTNGVSKDYEATIYTNFMVLLTEKTEFLNTAILVILDTKVKAEDKIKDVTSFNIFDEEKIKEAMSNPDGTKYPFALFKFYENGTIDDIKLPANMDAYYTQSIIELIENVVPKLTRNRTEDISNGLDIKTKKDKKKKTLVESQSPKEIPNFKGSKFVKSIERDIENDQLIKIRTDSNINLETKLEKDESSFGLKDFNYEQKSEIISTGLKEEKEMAESLIKLKESFTLIKSKDLIELLSKKENTDEVHIIDDEDTSKLRKLFNFNGDTTFTVKTYNALGVNVYIKVRFGCSGSKAFGYVIIEANGGKCSFGSDGVTTSRTWSGTVTIFSVPFSPIPGVTVNLKAGGSIKVSANLSGSNLKISVTGTLYADAGVKAGWDKVASISAGAKGTIIEATGTGTLNGSGKISTSGKLSAGKIVIYADGKTLGFTVFHHEMTVYEGWSKNL